MSEPARKTLRQLAGESAVDPWVCRKCGCCDWRVVNTYLRDGKRRRQRACRNCHTVLITQEVPVPAGHQVTVVRR